MGNAVPKVTSLVNLATSAKPEDPGDGSVEGQFIWPTSAGANVGSVFTFRRSQTHANECWIIAGVCALASSSNLWSTGDRR